MKNERPSPKTRIVVQTDGTVYAIGPKGGTRWVASLTLADLRVLVVDAQRAVDAKADVRRAIARVLSQPVRA